MSDRSKPRERAVEHVAGCSSPNIGDEPDATGIAFALRVVEKALLVAHCGCLSGREETELPPVFLKASPARREGAG